MSNAEPEKTRWGLIIVGLAVAGGIAWFDWSSRNEPAIEVVQPVERPEGATNARRDFVEALNKRGHAAALNPVAALPKSMLMATVERPLFTPTRRQPPKPAPIVVAPPPPPPPPDPNELQLVGVMIAGTGSVALVRLRGQQKTQPIRTGEIIGGWTIKEISSRDMTVRKEDVEATITVSSAGTDDPFATSGFNQSVFGRPVRPGAQEQEGEESGLPPQSNAESER